METKEKLIEIIKSTVVNAHGTKLGEVFHPEFVENIVNNLIEGGGILPPCKVGDKVYRISGNYYEEKIFEGVVDQIAICDNRETRFWVYGHPLGFTYEDIGKTVFLTREEAEKALKGGESDG